MTAVDDRPQTRDHAQMSLESFEHLAVEAERTEEGLRFEFLGGKLGVQPMPDSVHAAMVAWLVRQCMQQRPELDLMTGLQLKVETYRAGRAIPDAALVPAEHFLTVPPVDWVEPDGVLMIVEVTSYDRDTTQRDRIDKPRAYAECGIPVFLLVDRDARQVVVHTEPADGKYRDLHAVAFGESVTLPEPVGVTLDTEKLLRVAASARS